jgi:hypothetical protein
LADQFEYDAAFLWQFEQLLPLLPECVFLVCCVFGEPVYLLGEMWQTAHVLDELFECKVVVATGVVKLLTWQVLHATPPL